MANTQSNKGNPASHRASSTPAKDRRARSWARGEQRKQLRRTTQDAAAKHNRAKGGELTPWEQSKYDRRLRREIERRSQVGGKS
jgi:hypothetical protein